MARNLVDRLLQRLPRRAQIAADWLIGIGVAVAVVLALRAWVVIPYAIPTPSMEPTLHCAPVGETNATPPSVSPQPGQIVSPSRPRAGVSANGCQGSCPLGVCFSDRVLVNRFIFHLRSPHRGEVVAFEAPERVARVCAPPATSVLVKRLIGLPGDTVVEERGIVSVNGERLDESYVKPDRRDARSGTWKVPAGRYFFMGDNRASSCDSRDWGTVPRGDLVGSVFFTYWPLNRISFR